MRLAPFAILLILAAAVAVLVMAVIRLRRRQFVTIQAWEHGLLYQDGQFLRDLPPGRHKLGLGAILDPDRHRVERVLAVPMQLLVPMQEVLTADGFPVKLGAVLDWKVTAPRLWHESSVGRGEERLRTAVQLALRGVAQRRSLEALLAAREELAAELLGPVREATAGLGITVESAALRDLVLPAEVRRLVTEVERARREGMAALERARGEQAALRSLANAARLLRGNPELAQLRTLQALHAPQGRAAPTLVLGASVLPVPGEAAAALPETPAEGTD